MMKSRKIDSPKGWQWLVIGCIAGFMTGLFLTMIGAWFITIKDVGDTIVTGISYFVLMASCFVGGFFSAKYCGKDGLKKGAIVGVALFLSLVITGVIANGPIFKMHVIIKLLVSVISGVVGGVVGVNTVGKRKF